MPINYTSNSSYDIAKDTFRTQTKDFLISYTGLKPLTKHDVYVDDIEYNWATRQIGKNIGDNIISDVNGKLQIILYMEIPYEGSVSHDNIITSVSNNVIYNSQTEILLRNVLITNKIIEVKGNNSYGKCVKRFSMLLNNYHANRIEHHGH